MKSSQIKFAAMGHGHMDTKYEPAWNVRPSVLLNEITERTFPELFHKFYPKQYGEVGRYHSPKLVASALALAAGEAARVGVDDAPTAYRLMLPGMTDLIRHRVPLFFIAPALLHAIQRTDFKGDIDWTTMPLPYDNGIFVLPRGGYSHPEDGEVVFIFWSRLGPGLYDPPVTVGTEYYGPLPKLSLTNTSFSLVALTEKGMWYDSNLTTLYRPTLQLRNLFYRAEGEATPQIGKHSKWDTDLSEKDEGFLEDLGVILFGTLMAMAARPALYTPGQRLKVFNKKGAKREELWSPNVIGFAYRSPEAEPGDGTHASPRMHWRRGHFTHQPFGVGRKERKVIWREPVLVAAMKGEENGSNRT